MLSITDYRAIIHKLIVLWILTPGITDKHVIYIFRVMYLYLQYASDSEKDVFVK